MKLSAFTIIKDSIKLDFPIVESINSLLPAVSEYIINVGVESIEDTDVDYLHDDGTLDLIREHFGNNPKCKILITEWDMSGGTEFLSEATNDALEECSGDWVIYLQGDECVHENDLEKIPAWIDRAEAENAAGITLKYNHFILATDRVRKTYIDGHDAYDKELRIFRNDGQLFSFGDGQSFCFLEDALDPRGPQPALHHAERFIDSTIEVYHYGFLRSGEKLLEKKKHMASFYNISEPGRNEVIQEKDGKYVFDMGTLKEFNGTHPKVMLERMERFQY